MDFREIIVQKRYGKRLSHEQIDFFVRAVTEKSVPDYQISALLMAIVIHGMNEEEMIDLAMMMAHSGKVCDLSTIPGIKVDKHSTGGVGDKCTPIVMAIAASLGIPVVKLSGRGLGFTGGTIDKFESIQGFRTDIPVHSFAEMIRKSGAVLSGQTPELAPADKELYSLRDVTGTIDSIPLIATSIMSKKIAGGADAIVLDVTCGDGAFMKNTDAASELSKAMIRIGEAAGKPVSCVITSMRQPLGFSVGNILEMMEVEDVLSGGGPKDLIEVCIAIASSMVMLSDQCKDMTYVGAKEVCLQKLSGGEAKKAFYRFVQEQGGKLTNRGELAYTDRPVVCKTICAQEEGFLQEAYASKIGRASMLLGAGRKIRSDLIDPGAGIVLHKKIGDQINKGDMLCTLYIGSNSKIVQSQIEAATILAESAFVYSTNSVNLTSEVIKILS